MRCFERATARAALVLCCTSLASVLASGASAQRALDPYDVELARDLSVTLVAASVWAVPPLLRGELQRRSCPCDVAELNPLDRGTAGVWRGGLSTVSDLAVLGIYASGFALDALDVRATDAGLESWAKDALVMAQAIAINGAINELVKVAASRPRPLLYGRSRGDPVLRDGENYASFYSEHTSGAFAIGTGYAMTYALRHRRSPFRFVVGASLLLAGGAIGALRVASGKHFPTDVLTGAVVGAAIGWLVPSLHAHAPDARVSLVPRAGGAQLIIALAAE